ncbi:ATP-grasp domain-containing protein [Streptomyces caniferus]|uniref:ATP-grasp domain-containing protein n=1 Tax=Streptomyces caniferus TaxID=285557 RepID=A0ABZ1VGU2_9ACTN|nr:ATP-grasp domain-containing protein [Streptomyces caniferus]
MKSEAERSVLAFVNSDYADTPYDKWAADVGVQPNLLVSEAKFPQYQHVPGAVCVPDYLQGGDAERAALDLAERMPPSAVIARMESDLLRAARLRELLGVPGQDFASTLAFRDKVHMKTLVRQSGLEVPEFAPVRVDFDLFGFVREHGYPVVVKPALGSGSTGTQVLRGPADLARLLAEGLPEHAEVERFVEGQMYVVDGLVAAGAPVATFVSRYLNDCLSFHDGIYLGSAQLTRDHPLTDRLIGYARKVLDALPTPECATFHLEVFHTPDDRLVLCEIGSRTGGALTAPAIHAATGFNLDEQWFRAQVAPQTLADASIHGVAPGRSAGWVVFYPERGTLAALPKSPPPFVVEERLRATVGTAYEGGVKSAHYLAAYVLTGADDQEVEQRAQELAQWYAAGVRWTGLHSEDDRPALN